MKWDALKSRIQKAIDDPASDFHGYLFNEALSILVRERFMARAAHAYQGSKEKNICNRLEQKF